MTTRMIYSLPITQCYALIWFPLCSFIMPNQMRNGKNIFFLLGGDILRIFHLILLREFRTMKVFWHTWGSWWNQTTSRLSKLQKDREMAITTLGDLILKSNNVASAGTGRKQLRKIERVHVAARGTSPLEMSQHHYHAVSIPAGVIWIPIKMDATALWLPHKRLLGRSRRQ